MKKLIMASVFLASVAGHASTITLQSGEEMRIESATDVKCEGDEIAKCIITPYLWNGSTSYSVYAGKEKVQFFEASSGNALGLAASLVKVLKASGVCR